VYPYGCHTNKGAHRDLQGRFYLAKTELPDQAAETGLVFLPELIYCRDTIDG